MTDKQYNDMKKEFWKKAKELRDFFSTYEMLHKDYNGTN